MKSEFRQSIAINFASKVGRVPNNRVVLAQRNRANSAALLRNNVACYISDAEWIGEKRTEQNINALGLCYGTLDLERPHSPKSRLDPGESFYR